MRFQPSTLIVLLSVLVAPPARAGFSLGDASNFAILYEGNGGNTLSFSNSGITGNVGIGGTGKWADAGGCAGQCMIDGVIEFSAASVGQFTSNAGTTYIPALDPGVNPLYGQSNVQSDLNSLNSLSQTLGAETGTSVTIAGGSSINASAGTLDASGNFVFTATLSSSFTAGTTFTINGPASDFVVLNVASTGGHGFNGSIVLSGGITSDHVLINLTAGNYTTLSGGDTLTISTNGNTTMGTFLDPNGNIQINHSVLDGNLFGGDSQNFQFVSGAFIDAPAPSSVPEPSSLVLLGSALLIAKRVLRKKVWTS